MEYKKLPISFEAQADRLLERGLVADRRTLTKRLEATSYFRCFPEWYSGTFPSNRVGILLTICRYWLNQIAPTNTWTSRVFELFEQYPEIDTFQIGLPPKWREHPLWAEK